MKQIFAILFLIVCAISAQAQSSLTGLDDIMKNKVGAPFKIVFLHVIKQGQIDPAGSTLQAAQAAYVGLQEGATKAPSQYLDLNGQLKDEASKGAFRSYQKAMQGVIVEMARLVEILSDKTIDEATRLAAAKAQVQVIVRAQKQGHEDHKEE
tara:strand:- start:40793 stop:41248 length:456 start_codon:yes stop_codon:yes gene_type:complete